MLGSATAVAIAGFFVLFLDAIERDSSILSDPSDLDDFQSRMFNPASVRAVGKRKREKETKKNRLNSATNFLGPRGNLHIKF